MINHPVVSLFPWERRNSVKKEVKMMNQNFGWLVTLLWDLAPSIFLQQDFILIYQIRAMETLESTDVTHNISA